MNILKIDLFESELNSLLKDEDCVATEGIFVDDKSSDNKKTLILGQIKHFSKASNLTSTIRVAQSEIDKYRKRIEIKGFKNLENVSVRIESANITLQKIRTCRKILTEFSKLSEEELTNFNISKYKTDLHSLNVSLVLGKTLKLDAQKIEKVDIASVGWNPNTLKEAFREISDIKELSDSIENNGKNVQLALRSNRKEFAFYKKIVFLVFKEYLIITNNILRLVKKTIR